MNLKYVKQLHNWIADGSYRPENMRFYERHSFLWHWFMHDKFKEPFSRWSRLGGVHYFYYRNVGKRNFFKKQNRRFESPYIDIDYRNYFINKNKKKYTWDLL